MFLKIIEALFDPIEASFKTVPNKNVESCYSSCWSVFNHVNNAASHCSISTSCQFIDNQF
jgi:hypothetical protein